MGCSVNFKFPNTKEGKTINSLLLDTDLTREKLTLEQISDLLVDSSKLKELIERVNEVYTSSDKIIQMSEYKQDDLVPNYTKEEIMREFPGDWGEIPDNVLIVSNNYGIYNDGAYLFKRVVQVGLNTPVYVIPRSSIESFRLYTKLKSVLTRLNADEQGLEIPKVLMNELPILLNGTQQLWKMKLDKEILQLLLLQRRMKVIANLEATVKELENKNTHRRQINGLDNPRWFATYYNQKYEENYLKFKLTGKPIYKRKADDYKLKYTEQETLLKDELEKRKKILERMHKDDGKELLNINTLELNNDDELISVLENIKLIDANSKKEFKLPLSETIDVLLGMSLKAALLKIINHFVDHYDDWAKVLSISSLVNLKQGIAELLGKNVFKVSNDRFINSMNTVIREHFRGQSVIEVPKSEIIKVLKDAGFTDKEVRKEQLHLLLVLNYFGRGNYYNEVPSDSRNTIIFKRRYVSLYELHELAMGTEFNPQFQGKINGYYIYKYLTEKGQVRYFYSENPNSKKIKEFENLEEIDKVAKNLSKEKFETQEEIINFVKEISKSQDLSYNTLFLSDYNESDLEIFVPMYQKSYSSGEILSTLNLKKLGLPKPTYRIPKNFTREQFDLWVDSSFNEETDYEIIQRIKNELTSRDQIAYFYSRFHNIANYKLNSKSYSSEISLVKDVLDKLTKTPEELLYFKVVETKFIGAAPEPGKRDTRKRILRLLPLNNEQANESIKQSKIEKKSEVLEANYVAILQVFALHGVSVEYISSAEMAKLSGSTETIGWHSAGKIYINKNAKTTMRTVGHELAHMMLGWIKVNNPKRYEELLKKFENVKDSDQALRIQAEIQKKLENKFYLKEMENLSKDEKDFFLLEEVFCDFFGSYLNNKHERNMLDKTLFEEVKDAASKSTIFDDTNESLDDLLDSTLDGNKRVTKLANLMQEFSNQIKTARSKVGFGFIMNDGAIKKYENMIDNASDELIKNCGV